MLSNVVPFPDRIDFGRFTFPQKVALVAAHGGLDDQDVPAYLKLNSMRNKLAHRLDAALSERDEAELVNCLSAHLRHTSHVQDPRVAGQPWPYALRHAMAAMIIRLEYSHERIKEAREENRQTREKVVQVTQELRAAFPGSRSAPSGRHGAVKGHSTAANADNH